MNKNQLHTRTESINKKQKSRCRLSRQKALGWLTTRFPKAFDTSEQIFPLSIGIMNEILEHAEEAAQQGISKAKLREAVVIFTRRLDYLASLKAMGLRVNLLGEPCGEVTEEEAHLAAQKIKKRIEKSLKNQRKIAVEAPVRSYYMAESRSYDVHHEPKIKKPEIVFKTKSVKSIDPTAVERLKSKLGLHKKEEFME
ncbi:MAG: ProP effector [Pseudomonadota bacterium]|nr:ProP effector [Pseudomonadota bacterium]